MGQLTIGQVLAAGVVVGVAVMVVSGAVRAVAGRGGFGAAALDGALVGSLVAVALGTLSPLDVLFAGSDQPPRVNLVPFELLRGAPERYGVINLWLLTPTMILLAQRWRRAGVIRLIAAGIGMSALIEVVQLAHAQRGTNVDDLILNSAGVVVGAVVGVLIRWVTGRGRPRPPSPSPRVLEAEVPLRTGD